MKSDDWVVFFFFKQKTVYEMRISDWSSDVCSSDLASAWRDGVQIDAAHGRAQRHGGMGGVIFRPQQAMFFRRGRNEQDAAPGRRPRLQRAGKPDHACYAARIVDRAIADPVRRPGGQADAIPVPMGGDDPRFLRKTEGRWGGKKGVRK